MGLGHLDQATLFLGLLVTFLLSMRRALLPRNMVNLCIINHVALLLVLSVALLSRFVPTFFLPNGLASGLVHPTFYTGQESK